MPKNPPLYVGIDFSKHEVHYAVRLSTGQLLERHRCFDNSQVGYEQAKAWLQQLAKKQAADGLAIGGEATSYYWLPLYIQLVQDPDWTGYELDTYLLNARWVKWFKKSRSPNSKSDKIDPGEIAEYIRLQAPRNTWQYEEHWLPLRFETRLRSHFVRSRTREKNLFDLYLFLAHSTYTQYRPFSSSLSKTSQRVLENPDQYAQWRQSDAHSLAEQLSAFSLHHLSDPLQNAQRLQQTLQDSYPLAGALEEPIQFGLAALLSTIQSLDQQIEEVEKRIAARVAQGYPEVAWLDSIPGIGPVLASGIAAEIGDVSRFTRVPVWDERHHCPRQRTAKEIHDALCKYAGLWWPKNASGQFEAEEHHLSRQGNAYLRYYVLEAADRMRLHIPDFQKCYERKYAQATKHHHKRALVLTGAKALGLFATLLRRQEPYRAREVDRS